MSAPTARTRIVVVTVCAGIGAALGFAYGAAIFVPGAMLEGEVLSGGNRRIFSTGLGSAGLGLTIGAVLGGIAALLLRARRSRRAGPRGRA